MVDEIATSVAEPVGAEPAPIETQAAPQAQSELETIRAELAALKETSTRAAAQLEMLKPGVVAQPHAAQGPTADEQRQFLERLKANAKDNPEAFVDDLFGLLSARDQMHANALREALVQRDQYWGEQVASVDPRRAEVAEVMQQLGKEQWFSVLPRPMQVEAAMRFKQANTSRPVTRAGLPTSVPGTRTAPSPSAPDPMADWPEAMKANFAKQYLAPDNDRGIW